MVERDAPLLRRLAHALRRRRWTWMRRLTTVGANGALMAEADAIARLEESLFHRAGVGVEMRGWGKCGGGGGNGGVVVEMGSGSGNGGMGVEMGSGGGNAWVVAVFPGAAAHEASFLTIEDTLLSARCPPPSASGAWSWS